MKVYNRNTTGSPQAHYRFYDFDRFEHPGKFVFIDSPQVFTEMPREIFEEKIVYLELEEPNRFFVNVDWFNHFDYDKYFFKIFSICPYTTKWLNSIYGTNREHTFIPICHKEQSTEKLYDIIYAGHIYEGNIENDVSILKHFNYRIVSNTDHPMTTNKCATHNEKLRLIAQSKISLVHNLLYPTIDHIDFIKTIPEYHKNEAFSLLDWGIVPQIKGRTFEAALCKSLILCQRDPFNVIEHYFDPNKDFIYYDKEHIKEQITDILDNYEIYLPIIESAYSKAQQYTTESFFNKHLRNLT
jgi:DNA-directed RNA polymerase subunit F